MKRLLLGAIAAAYLGLIGLQAAHYHKDGVDSKDGSCAVCVLAHQSVSQAPNATPALAQSADFRALIPAASDAASAAFYCEASARAPPAAV